MAQTVTNEMPEYRPPEVKEKLLGGWLPASIWGTGPKPRRKRSTKSETPLKHALLSANEIAVYRRRTYWLRAVIQDNLKPGRGNFLPLGLDHEYIDGEKYFLILCQTMYREARVKNALGEPQEGEDFLERLIDWWAQGPLENGHVHAALKGTSLKEEDDDE